MSTGSILEECVRDRSRDAITNNEKLVSTFLVIVYIPLLLMTIKNLVRFYEKERQKIYNFMPTINVLLFTCIYTRIAVYLDGTTVLQGLFKGDFRLKNDYGYLYKKDSVIWFISITSFAALNITCAYIASTLASLLTAFMVIKHEHLAFRNTIKGATIIVNIYQLIVAIGVIVWGENDSKIEKLLLISTICCTLSLLTIAGFCFVYNFTKIFKINPVKKRLIEVGCVFMIVCLMYDMIIIMGSLDLLRMKSCTDDGWTWPLIVLLFELSCKFTPIFCFTQFFSTKLSLYSQN